MCPNVIKKSEKSNELSLKCQTSLRRIMDHGQTRTIIKDLVW